MSVLIRIAECILFWTHGTYELLGYLTVLVLHHVCRSMEFWNSIGAGQEGGSRLNISTTKMFGC
jgi:hypothetical protein